MERLRCEIEQLRGRIAQQDSVAPRPLFDVDVLENLSLGFIALDAEWRYVYMNAAAEKHYGRMRAELLGHNYWEAHPYLRGSEIERRFRTTLETGSHEDFEYEAGGRWWDLRTSRHRAGGILVYFQDVTNRRHAEAALRDAEARYRAMTEQSPFSTQVFDRSGKTIRVNPAWEALWGVTLEDLGGYNILEDEQFVRLGLRPYIDRAFQGEVVAVPEIPYCPDRGQNTGRAIWVKAFLYPLRDDSGAIREIVLIHEDVTDRKRSEQCLREVNSQLNTIVKNSPLPIITLTAKGEITLWNPAAERAFGWTEAEVLGKPLPFIPDAKLDEHREMRTRDLAGQGFAGKEVRRVRKDGSPIDLSVSTAPLLDEHGNIVGIMSLYIDITERKRVEAALRQSEQTYRFLAESIPQMVWTTTPEGILDYINRRGAEYLGRPREDIDPSVWTDALHPEDCATTIDNWRACLRSGDVYESLFRLRRFDGEYHWHLSRALPFRDSEGRILRWFGTCTDIEEQKRTEAELRRANEDLNQFAYSASHDLQEPLRMIGTFTQLLARRYEGKLDPAADTYIGYAVEGVRRMHALIAGLLTYTRVVNITIDDTHRAGADEALSAALSNLGEMIRTSGAHIEAHPLPPVRMRHFHLMQVFQNLVGNAIKYRGEGPPRIEIWAERRLSEWVFSVQDNGIGIDPEYKSQVFGMFKRLHTNSAYEGTGIGLAICHKIVERYGGKIWVESEGEGKGACFRFTVAAAE
jgi:PAS domain S-box-containing protein